MTRKLPPISSSQPQPTTSRSVPSYSHFPTHLSPLPPKTSGCQTVPQCRPLPSVYSPTSFPPLTRVIPSCYLPYQFPCPALPLFLPDHPLAALFISHLFPVTVLSWLLLPLLALLSRPLESGSPQHSNQPQPDLHDSQISSWRNGFPASGTVLVQSIGARTVDPQEPDLMNIGNLREWPANIHFGG